MRQAPPPDSERLAQDPEFQPGFEPDIVGMPVESVLHAGRIIAANRANFLTEISTGHMLSLKSKNVIESIYDMWKEPIMSVAVKRIFNWRSETLPNFSLQNAGQNRRNRYNKAGPGRYTNTGSVTRR